MTTEQRKKKKINRKLRSEAYYNCCLFRFGFGFEILKVNDKIRIVWKFAHFAL